MLPLGEGGGAITRQLFTFTCIICRIVLHDSSLNNILNVFILPAVVSICCVQGNIRERVAKISNPNINPGDYPNPDSSNIIFRLTLVSWINSYFKMLSRCCLSGVAVGKSERHLYAFTFSNDNEICEWDYMKYLYWNGQLVWTPALAV